MRPQSVVSRRIVSSAIIELPQTRQFITENGSFQTLGNERQECLALDKNREGLLRQQNSRADHRHLAVINRGHAFRSESNQAPTMTMMTDAQLVKVFSLNFTCAVIAALHRDVRRKTVSPRDLAADLGKLHAFVEHVDAAFQTLTAGEQYSCELAARRVVDILRYAGQSEEAARIELDLSRLMPCAA